MRFSKGAGVNILEFPITAQSLSKLTPCNIVNPQVGKRHGLIDPTWPEDGEAHDKIQSEVIQARMYTDRNKLPKKLLERYHPRDDYDGSIIPEPLIAAGIEDAKSAALAVRMDHPFDLAQFCLDWLLMNGGKLKQKHTAHADFLNPLVASSAYMLSLIHI